MNLFRDAALVAPLDHFVQARAQEVPDGVGLCLYGHPSPTEFVSNRRCRTRTGEAVEDPIARFGSQFDHTPD